VSTLVVVATHNGSQFLPHWLEWKHPSKVLLVDTGSTESRALEMLRQPPEGIEVTRTPFKGYDTGAYLWAYWNYPADEYLFLHDSMEPMVEDYIQPFRTAMTRRFQMVAWSGFPTTVWDSKEQHDAIMWLYPWELPPLGIFGPVFFTNRDTLQHMDNMGCLPSYPTHKLWAQGLERIWSSLAHKANVPVTYLRADHAPIDMEEGRYPVFKKWRPVRA